MYEELLHKSKNNYEIGEKAENLKYFDVAISRYYYSLYQKLNFILRKKYGNFNIPNKKNSHEETIDKLFEYITDNHPDIELQYIMDLSQLRELRSRRNEADYKPILTLEIQFHEKFKKPFKLCDEALNALRKGE